MSYQQYPALQLQPADKALLGEYRRAKFDPQTGLAWIEDGTAGVAHSAHPNVEANRQTRRLLEFSGWVESRGFLYSPEVFCSTDLDKLIAPYCQCNGCIRSRRAR